MTSPAEDREAAAVAGYDGVASDDVYDVLDDGSTAHGTGPNGVQAPNKFEKAVALKGVTEAEVTSVNPGAYTADEETHRFTNVPPAGYKEPTFPHPQV